MPAAKGGSSQSCCISSYSKWHACYSKPFFSLYTGFQCWVLVPLSQCQAAKCNFLSLLAPLSLISNHLHYVHANNISTTRLIKKKSDGV
jgi:hypothetical protein